MVVSFGHTAKVWSKETALAQPLNRPLGIVTRILQEQKQ